MEEPKVHYSGTHTGQQLSRHAPRAPLLRNIGATVAYFHQEAAALPVGAPERSRPPGGRPLQMLLSPDVRRLRQENVRMEVNLQRWWDVPEDLATS